MLKMVAAGVTALFVSDPTSCLRAGLFNEVTERLGAADLSALTDARINIVNAT